MPYVRLPYNLKVQIDPIISGLKLEVDLRTYPKCIPRVSPQI